MSTWVNEYCSQVRVNGCVNGLSEWLALFAYVVWRENPSAFVWLVAPHVDDDRAELSDDSREAGDTNPSALGRKMYRNSITKDAEEAVCKNFADLLEVVLI